MTIQGAAADPKILGSPPPIHNIKLYISFAHQILSESEFAIYSIRKKLTSILNRLTVEKQGKVNTLNVLL